MVAQAPRRLSDLPRGCQAGSVRIAATPWFVPVMPEKPTRLTERVLAGELADGFDGYDVTQCHSGLKDRRRQVRWLGSEPAAG
jgi:hypothetical protein